MNKFNVNTAMAGVPLMSDIVATPCGFPGAALSPSEAVKGATMRAIRFILALAAMVLSSCATEPAAKVVPPGEPLEGVVGFDDNDVRACVSDIVIALNRDVSQRVPVRPGCRLPVEIRPFACEGVPSDQSATGRLLASRLEEELTDSGLFYFVTPGGRFLSESEKSVTATHRIEGEFIQRKMRTEKCRAYLDFTVKVRMVDLSLGGAVFARNFAIRKIVKE